MDFIQSLILGALQGITEFLPISSSGHLVLGEHYFQLNTETLKNFDVAVHMGTLLAILIYFWNDVWRLIKTFFGLIVGKVKVDDPYAKLILYIVIGTIPAVVAGLFLDEWIDETFRNIKTVATCMIIVGIIFLIVDRGQKQFKNMKLSKAIFIGCAQAVALIPGVSRSGSTIVAGLFQGIERSAAARFSFLLGIPAMFGAGILTFMKSGEEIGGAIAYQSIIGGFMSSFLVGLLSVAFLMKFLKKNSLNIFAIYLILIGGITLIN